MSVHCTQVSDWIPLTGDNRVSYVVTHTDLHVTRLCNGILVLFDGLMMTE